MVGVYKWSPLTDDDSLTVDVELDIYLSESWLSLDSTSGWNLDQITLDRQFHYDATNLPIATVTAIEYEVYVRNSSDGTEDWRKRRRPLMFWCHSTLSILLSVHTFRALVLAMSTAYFMSMQCPFGWGEDPH